MNKKINSIIAIILIIIIISLLVIITIPQKEKTPADIINEKLREENASWVATDYPKKILNIPITQKIKELELYSKENIDESPIFNIETKDRFSNEYQNSDDLNKTKTKNTGLFLLTKTTIASPIYEYEDQINWGEYLTPNKNQTTCGSCNAFALIGAIEGYINHKYNLSKNNKLDLSEQYLISYTNFKGCTGAGLDYYIKFISLSSYNKNTNFNEYLKKKIKGELNLENKLISGTRNLQTKTQLSFDAGEAPFGVPLENQLRYLAYDSCEIGKLNKITKKSTTNMNLNSLLIIGTDRLNLSDIDNNFCPDSSDSDDQNNIFTPIKNNYNKYFIENHFKIDNSDCKTIDKKNTIKNIKEALKFSPLATSIYYYPSMSNYKSGIWSKISDEGNPIYAHGVTIVGWGVDNVRNKEYWILKNNWGEDWGENGYFRIWMRDKDTQLECSIIYGFSGELITKSGQEINSLIPIVKTEIEQEKLNTNKKQEMEIQKPENIPIQIENQDSFPNSPIDINPLNEYNIININYQDIKYITDTKCISIINCISNKLTNFYGIDNTTQENELT